MADKTYTITISERIDTEKLSNQTTIEDNDDHG